MALAQRAETPGHFTKVISAIDAMINTLKAEETSDLALKEKCEKERADNTRDAIKLAREIDDFSDTITTRASQIEELTAQIAEADQQMADITKELGEMKTNRDAEKVEHDASEADDIKARDTVQSAITVLESFYKDNNLMFVQQGVHQSPAGDAPPPPPGTWDSPYGGKTAESGGIIAILGMIKEDIQEDIDKANSAETKAVTAYGALKTDLTTERTDTNTTRTTLDGTKGTKETEKATATTNRNTKHANWVIKMDAIAAEETGCDYFTINYDQRRTNRQIEFDGLKKAKAILNGAAFGL